MFEGARKATSNGRESIRKRFPGNGAMLYDATVGSVAPGTGGDDVHTAPSLPDPSPQPPNDGSRSAIDPAPVQRRQEPARTKDRVPTEAQRRYIKVLGGDSSGVQTRQEASDLIKQRLLLRGTGPLDPARLEARGRRAGEETNGEWRPAHRGLLAGVSLELQEYLNLSVDSLRSKLSDPLGPAGSSQLSGPGEMARRAEEELRQLELCRKYDQPLHDPPVAIPDLPPPLNADTGPSAEETEERVLRRVMARPDQQERPPAREDERAAAETSPDDEGPKAPSWQRWLPLIAILVVCVTTEAGLNIFLLMGALPGGALEAFTLAVLISMINVGGFGITAGLFFRWVGGQISSAKPRWYWAAGGLLALAFFAVGFNYRDLVADNGRSPVAG